MCTISSSIPIFVGCSVVLTSHSMEECESLCHRLVIMVCGSFQCIGSVQYLKNKFGNQYTFKIKTKDRQEEIKQFIQENVPGSVLLEEHLSLIQYQVPAGNLNLSQLFSILNQCKITYSAEDYSITQTTLEHVFVSMAKVQENISLGLQNPQIIPQNYPSQNNAVIS